jgi:hypothetical protein
MSNGYMLFFDISWCIVLMESRGVVGYRYLTSMWTIELCIRYCDICKVLTVQIRAYIDIMFES